MRNDLSGAPGFAELLGRIKQTALEAYAHQELPFEKACGRIHPTRDMSHAPLFQVAFILQNTPVGSERPNCTIWKSRRSNSITVWRSLT